LREQEARMLEFTAIAIAVLSGVAIISAKVGHRLGAKRAMREIVRVFQREIVSNDDELKSVAEHLHRSRDVTKIAIGRTARLTTEVSTWAMRNDGP
jgi:hypothetical protein